MTNVIVYVEIRWGINWAGIAVRDNLKIVLDRLNKLKAHTIK